MPDFVKNLMSCHEVTCVAELSTFTLATAGQREASVTNTKGKTVRRKYVDIRRDWTTVTDN
jgi:hypothetical protein